MQTPTIILGSKAKLRWVNSLADNLAVIQSHKGKLARASQGCFPPRRPPARDPGHPLSTARRRKQAQDELDDKQNAQPPRITSTGAAAAVS